MLIQNSGFDKSYLNTLDLFFRADTSVTDLSVPTVCAICPREVPSHTHQMTIGLSCAPQATAWWLHEGTGLGGFSKRKLTLTVQVVRYSWQHTRQDKWFLRLVKQTLP